jgi:hypothetical protein
MRWALPSCSCDRAASSAFEPWLSREADSAALSCSVPSSYEEFFPEEGESIIYDEYGNETGVYKYTDRNKLVLYTMTQEFYKYKVAQELIIDNASMFAGLAPINFCYSNITNGYGAFAGVSIVETDWITREFIENNR